jgi:hypothetical protein
MKIGDLSREQIYELVWSKPMSHAAREFDISDVMLGKICKEHHIPRPPRGYWMKLRSEKKRIGLIKPPLPGIPTPKNTFNLFMLKELERQRTEMPYDFDPNDLSIPVPSPPEEFPDTLNDYRRFVESNFPELPDCSQCVDLHPIASKVYEADRALVAMRKRDLFFSLPQYEGEAGKLKLQLLNYFIQCFEFLGLKVQVAGKKNFSFHVTVFGQQKEFHVFILKKEPSVVRRLQFKEKKRMTFCFSWTSDHEYITPGSKYYEFEELSSSCVKNVIINLAIKREEDYRDSVFSIYESRVERRKTAIKQKAERERRSAEIKRKAHEELIAHRVQIMDLALNDMNKADLIRSLINTVQEKAKESDQQVEGLSHWVGWAQHHANMIDLRHRSIKGISAWINGFKFKS